MSCLFDRRDRGPKAGGAVPAADAGPGAGRLAVEGAVDRGANHHKIELAPRVVARAILTIGGLT
ncbi:hypothetical protein QO011_000423 [Labrys wisconsinensis]|uniref:Uncharacterized protein n=1 Tax=Labrys wisconsinensis TaxID=425677 RepID=A0ABU0J1V8_9HYPH|nr:hypothetical protein [Labrys wisconsinensis]